MAKVLVLAFLMVLGSSLISSVAAQNVRIAYLLSIDDIGGVQVVFRMLRMFYSDEDTFVIHVNSDLVKGVLDSVDNFTKSLREPTPENDNIIIISTQLVHYGGISQIEAHLDMMWYALKSNREWDTALLLNGNTYPLKSRAEIKRRLTLLKGKNLLDNDGTGGYDSPVLKTVRLKKFYIENLTSVYHSDRVKGQRRLPADIDFRLGSPVVALNRRFCQALMTGDVARNMLLLFSTTLYPLEMYYQTVLFNMNEFKGTVLKEKTDASSLYFSESNAYESAFFVEEWLDQAVDSNAMFVGRVNPQSTTLLDKIDERIHS